MDKALQLQLPTGRMVVNQHQRFVLQDKTFANLVKRDITRIAESYGFAETEVGKINIIVSELISNLFKYTPKGGEILIKPIENNGIEIISLDNGPGMSDTQRMMRDGTSTSGTAGEGLGAIKRLSIDFDIYSQPGLGTIVLSRIFKPHKRVTVDLQLRDNRFDVGVVMVPMHNEALCGDGCAIITEGNNLYLIAVDGLGHGANANEASAQAAANFLLNHTSDPAANLHQIHSNIRKTRGAVGTIVHINASRKKINHCGVGNIAGKIFTIDGAILSNMNSRNIIAYNGILGHNIPTTFSTQQSEWSNNNMLILHSDGILSRWDLSKYPNLHRHDPSLIAGIIYRDFNRKTDDSLVVIIKPKA